MAFFMLAKLDLIFVVSNGLLDGGFNVLVNFGSEFFKDSVGFEIFEVGEHRVILY
jgi:hypothetical protein